MALYQHKVIADEPDGNGIVRGRILDEMEEIPCEHCGSESMPQRCATDGKYHYHGQVHVSGRLIALCNDCSQRFNA